MILGLGSDLVDIRRIERTIKRFGERFLIRVFTEEERSLCKSRGGHAAGYAKRFAAKEACAKALGTGFGRDVSWCDIGVVNEYSGRPVMRLSGGAARRLGEITPPGMTARIDLSLSDERFLAQAVVIISASHRHEEASRIAALSGITAG
jgi:holo-[acyl-carrier protein] synthase